MNIIILLLVIGLNLVIYAIKSEIKSFKDEVARNSIDAGSQEGKEE